MAAMEQTSADGGGIVKVVGGIEGAGAGGGFGLNAPGAGPKVTHFAAKATKKSVGVPEELTSVWNDIIGDEKDTTWVICEYDSSGKNLEIKSTGTAGLAEFKAGLSDTLAWGGLRVTAVDDRENTISRRPKFLFVQFMPPGAPAMRKAKMGSHKGTVKQALHSAHMDLCMDDKSELEETDLVKRLQAATGAHKPNGYEFDPGVITSAEGFST